MKRIAVIDIGSNSTRLLISEIIKGENYKTLLEEKDTIRLGREVFEKGFFGHQSISKALRTLKNYRKIIKSYNVEHFRAVATAAFREASNREETVNFLSKETGINIEVISGKEEGELIFLGVAANHDLQDRKTMVIDIGGGSCEIARGTYKGIDNVITLGLGCTKLTRFFLKSNPVKSFEVELLKQHIDSLLKRFKLSEKKKKSDLVIGTGGSLNNLTEIIYKMLDKPDSDLTRTVKLSQVKELNEELIKRDYRKRLKLPGLEKKRVDIILAAGIVIEKLLKFYNKKSFTSHSKGLRDGLTIDTINRLGIIFPYQTDNEYIVERKIWEIGHRYLFEEKHAENVTELAMRLYDELKEKFDFKEKWKSYLRAAAMLHDIGYYISFSGHHKHSQYLIENSELIGFDDREVNIIANIARYHRKTFPKKSHLKYQKLDSDDKEIVKKMSAVLRVADALDRSHRETIHDFKIKFNSDELRLIINAKEEDLFFEREGIVNKGDFFQQVFDYKVVLEANK